MLSGGADEVEASSGSYPTHTAHGAVRKSPWRTEHNFLQEQAEGEMTSAEGWERYDTGVLSFGSGQDQSCAVGLVSLPLLCAGSTPRCPLSAGLQVLVCEHVELAVQPPSFIPARKQSVCNTACQARVSTSSSTLRTWDRGPSITRQ